MRLLLVLCLVASARGQSLPGIGPRLPEVPAPESLPPVRAAADVAPGGEVLVKGLEQIVLAGPEDGEEARLADGLAATRGLPVPAPRKLAAKLRRWHGQPLDIGQLASLADDILIHYDRAGYPVVSLEVPEQDFSAGVLRLRVAIGRFGEVGVSRPRRGDPAVIAKGMRLRSGEPVRRGDIDGQLAWYGRTAFRRARLFVSPGLGPATADLLIAFEESRPWRVSVGYEDSGPDLLGRDRFLLGVAGWTPGEHLLAWQSVVGLPASSLLANALRWEIPFHGCHQVLQLDAAYAEVRSRYATGGTAVESEGSSWALTARQRIPLPAWGGWRQSFSAGLELKGTDQFLLFDEGSLAPGEVVFFHGALSHGLSRSWESGGASFESTLIAAPGGLGANNSDAAFRAYDPAAESDYLIGRLTGGGWWTPGGDWQLQLRAAAQVADSRLLPAEQFGAGGHASVRGAGEREFSADQGWQSSLELYSPRISIRDACAFRVLAFFDHAGLDQRGGASSSVTGTGIGLRMQVAERLDLRLDHGWRLDDPENRFHFGMSVSF